MTYVMIFLLIIENMGFFHDDCHRDSRSLSH
nr:MAG TPA: hypothetical protein [Caudoviricetes sp.]